MNERQEQLNKAIHAAGPEKAGKFSAKTMETIMRDGGSVWRYEGPSYNTNAYRKGWDRIFGKKEKEHGC